jgi:hypothetical protein
VRKTKTFIGVEKILGDNIHAQTGIGPRDSDNELILQFLHFHTDMEVTPAIAETIRSISFESITRARRKLQEKGEYMPDSPAVWKKRRLKGWELQQVAPVESAAGIQRRIEEN